MSKVRVAILTDVRDRIKLLKDLAGKLDGAAWEPYSGSTAGLVRWREFTILAKPKKSQGMSSAGLQNESILIDAIRGATQKCGCPLCVSFNSPEKSIKFPNIVSVEDAGRDTKDRKKADIRLVDSYGHAYPISVKKSCAEIWESADSFYGSRAKSIVDRLCSESRALLIDKGHYKNIKPNLAIRATDEEMMDVVFGSDILRDRGCIISQTFSGDDFKLMGETLNIPVQYFIEKPEDLYDEIYPYFLIRNDQTRAGKDLYPGLRVLAVYRKRINKNVLIVEENS